MCWCENNMLWINGSFFIQRTVEQQFQIVEENLFTPQMLEITRVDILDQLQRNNSECQATLTDYLPESDRRIQGELTKTHGEMLEVLIKMWAQGQATAEAVDPAQRATGPAAGMARYMSRYPLQYRWHPRGPDVAAPPAPVSASAQLSCTASPRARWSLSLSRY